MVVNAKQIQQLKQQANQGDARAQYEMALCYYTGESTEKCYGQAVYWFKKAADQGHAGAHYFRACAYYAGRGIKQSDEQASYWLTRAAEQGHAEAKKILTIRQERKTKS